MKRSQPPDPRCQRSAPSFPARRGHIRGGRAEPRRRLPAVPLPGGPAAARTNFAPVPTAAAAAAAAAPPGSSRPRQGRCCPRGAPAPARRAGAMRRCPGRSLGGGMQRCATGLGTALPGPASASRTKRQWPRPASRPPAPMASGGEGPPSAPPVSRPPAPTCAAPGARRQRAPRYPRDRCPRTSRCPRSGRSGTGRGTRGDLGGAEGVAPSAQRRSRAARAGAPPHRAALGGGAALPPGPPPGARGHGRAGAAPAGERCGGSSPSPAAALPRPGRPALPPESFGEDCPPAAVPVPWRRPASRIGSRFAAGPAGPGTAFGGEQSFEHNSKSFLHLSY